MSVNVCCVGEYKSLVSDHADSRWSSLTSAVDLDTSLCRKSHFDKWIVQSCHCNCYHTFNSNELLRPEFRNMANLTVLFLRCQNVFDSAIGDDDTADRDLAMMAHKSSIPVLVQSLVDMHLIMYIFFFRKRDRDRGERDRGDRDRDREIEEEEEAHERRKLEKKMREKEAAYQEVE